jgi:ankyrin repeat protein
MMIDEHHSSHLRQNMVNVAHVACLHDRIDVLRWAVSQAPSLIADQDPMGRLPLHWCAASEASSSGTAGLQVLIDAGRGTATPWIQLEHRDLHGMTARDIILSQQEEMVTMTQDDDRGASSDDDGEDDARSYEAATVAAVAAVAERLALLDKEGEAVEAEF